MVDEWEARQIDLWIGARLGLRSGAYGGTVAGILLGAGSALLVMFTDFRFSGLQIFSIFWLAGVYGFILGILAGALGGLVGGAVLGATRVPRKLTAVGAGAGAGFAILLMAFFFLLYSWVNTGTAPLAILVDLAPVALIAAVGGAIGGAVAGRRFKQKYEIRPTLADYEHRWEREA